MQRADLAKASHAEGFAHLVIAHEILNRMIFWCPYRLQAYIHLICLSAQVSFTKIDELSQAGLGRLIRETSIKPPRLQTRDASPFSLDYLIL